MARLQSIQLHACACKSKVGADAGLDVRMKRAGLGRLIWQLVVFKTAVSKKLHLLAGSQAGEGGKPQETDFVVPQFGLPQREFQLLGAGLGIMAAEEHSGVAIVVGPTLCGETWLLRGGALGELLCHSRRSVLTGSQPAPG